MEMEKNKNEAKHLIAFCMKNNIKGEWHDSTFLVALEEVSKVRDEAIKFRKENKL